MVPPSPLTRFGRHARDVSRSHQVAARAAILPPPSLEHRRCHGEVGIDDYLSVPVFHVVSVYRTTRGIVKWRQFEPQFIVMAPIGQPQKVEVVPLEASNH